MIIIIITIMIKSKLINNEQDKDIKDFSDKVYN